MNIKGWWKKQEAPIKWAVLIAIIWQSLFMTGTLVFNGWHLTWFSKNLEPWATSPTFNFTSSALASCIAAVFLLLAAWKWRHHTGAFAWLMLGTGLFIFTCANAIYLYLYITIYGPDSYPHNTIADPILLLGLPFLLVGLAALPASLPKKSGTNRFARLIIDLLMVLVIIGGFGWYYIYNTQILNNFGIAVSLRVFAAILIASAIFGFFYLFIKLVAFIPQSIRYRNGLITLVTGVICWIASQLGYEIVHLYNSGGYLPGIWPDSLLHFSYLLFFLCGIMIYERVPAQKVNKTAPITLLILGFIRRNLNLSKSLFSMLVALCVSVTLMITAGFSSSAERIITITMAFVVLIISVRHALTIADNYRMYEAEHRYAGKLEMLVRKYRTARQETSNARASEQLLYDLNKKMDTFLSMASHEMKTPLASIKMYLQLASKRLQKQAEDKEATYEDFAEKVENVLKIHQQADRQVSRLTRLINDLLDDSKIQQQKFDLKIDQSNLTTLVMNVVNEQQSINTNRIIHLTMDDSISIFLQADTDRIAQVLENFVTNACKYTDEAEPINIALQVEGENARVSVTDRGPGIPADSLQKIWERFYQVEGNGKMGVGLGLGLHISQVIIDLHHGEIGADSTEGQGSTFWFTLPIESIEQNFDTLQIKPSQIKQTL